MKTKTALKIAIECMRREQRSRYAFNANLYKRGIVRPATESHYKQYQRYEEAIDILRQESETKDVKQKD